MSLSDKIIWGIAIVLLLPVLVSPAGWLFGLTLAVGWLLAAYLTKYLLDLEKHRREGERGMIADVRRQRRKE